MNKQKHNHCGCGHCHSEIEENEMKEKSNKIEIIKLFSSFVVFILAIILPVIKINILELQIILFLLTYLIIGWEVIKRVIINLFDGHVLEEHFLMTIATISAFVIGEYPEAVMVMWLYKVGEFFQEYALGKSRKSIASLMNIRPEIANLERNGEVIETEPQKVKIGEIIVVKPGEKVPLDGIVIDGESYLDTIALTGESVPRKVTINENIYSGCINQNGLLKIKVTKNYEDSAVSKILNLVEHANERKSKAENFINKFAKYYTPIVVVLAVLLACIPPLFTSEATWSDYIYRACSFLVISCPCALVISIPLGFFGGIGGASKFGVLVKGSNYLEILSKVKAIVVDKTGTLTKGVFEVTGINPNNISKEELLEITAMAELYSEHPIALSIKKAYSKEIDKNRVDEVEEIAGHGILAKIDNKKVYAGNLSLMQKMQIKIDTEEIEKAKNNKFGTIIYVAMGEQYLGNIVISDQIKSEAKQFVIDSKKKGGIQNLIMLTGDNKNVAEYVAKELKITKVYAELLPNNKVEKVEEFISQKLGKVAFVGDGINDAPVLTRADVGIAMGGLGSDAAIEAADVVIMNDDLLKIVKAIVHSKRTMKIIKQNIIFALLVKFGILILGALGYADMWQAVFADVGVSFIAILNSLRAMNIKKY